MKKGVQQIFSRIVPTYELINHLLTWSLDIHWRRRAARLAPYRRGSCWLDICTGTGEMAFNIAKAWEKDFSRDETVREESGHPNHQEVSSHPSLLMVPAGGEGGRSLAKVQFNSSHPNWPLVVGLDFCREMLVYARRTKTPGVALPMVFAQADVGQLPFAEETFAGVSISFATRNLGLTAESLVPFFREIHRVLQPGGLFINLETSQPRPKWLRKMFHAYIRLTVKPLGQKISGSAPGYAYLASTIPRFLSREELRTALRQAGFHRVEIIKLWLRLAAIHLAYKAGSS